MATLTRAEMINRVLQRLGVLANGSTASAEDGDIVGQVLDSVHDQYRKRGLAPFATSAFPAWAQEPFAKIIAADASPYYGLDHSAFRAMGEKELVEQMHDHISRTPTRFKAY